jgi:hypothetical protein
MIRKSKTEWWFPFELARQRAIPIICTLIIWHKYRARGRCETTDRGDVVT